LPGVPVALTWRLTTAQGMTQLYYQADAQPAWLVAQWAGNNEGFRYLTATGQWQTEWTSDPNDTTQPQLPKAIMLHGRQRLTDFTWMVPIAHHGDAAWDIREVYRP